MKTLIVNIPEKDQSLIIALLKKFKLSPKVLTEEEKEDMMFVKLIDEGMQSEDVPIERIYEKLRQ